MLTEPVGQSWQHIEPILKQFVTVFLQMCFRIKKKILQGLGTLSSLFMRHDLTVVTYSNKQEKQETNDKP